MIRVFVDSNGQVLKTISGNEETVEMNTSEEDTYLDVETLPIGNVYWDFSTETFVDYGTSSDPYLTFNFKTRVWEDTRSLEDIKQTSWNKLKKARDELEFGGFEFNGNIYDSDQMSQGRISAAASLGAAIEWTLADNSTIWLEPEDLQALVVALAEHVTSVHARGKIAREVISNATTVDDVKAVVL